MMASTKGSMSRGAPARPRRHRRWAPWILLAPFTGLFVLTVLAPIGMAIAASFTRVTRSGAFGEGGTTTQFAGLENYHEAFANHQFILSLGRMVLFGAVQVPVMLGLAVVLALLLESGSARWPEFFRSAFFLPYGIPGVIASILWSFLYMPGVSPFIDAAEIVGLSLDFTGPNAVLWSIANIVTWSYTGYNMLIIVAQLKAIPAEVYDAAALDGAGRIRVGWSIQLPLIRPALVLTGAFSVIGTLQLFAEPQMMQQISTAVDSQYTPNMAAYAAAFAYGDYPLAAAEAVVIAGGAFLLSTLVVGLSNRKGKL